MSDLQVHAPAFGHLLKEWRAFRRLSQLDLALAAESSARHVSFLETGRAQPSREMVLKLAEALEVPLRERNTLLSGAGYAPMYRGPPWGMPRSRRCGGRSTLCSRNRNRFPR
ncbi:MAG: helix-turn-helix transcriptional regulator [Proteobacteria bacterium]|nr:helix-turn-helix transcriptional regulator [Pseudomonadota bacterium]